MKFLIDTNVFIPLEPTAAIDIEHTAPVTAELSRIAIEYGHQLYLHPRLIDDISKDRNSSRFKLRQFLASKYPSLSDPPKPSPELRKILGDPTKGTNDWLDNHLLSALNANTVDFLVTEDKGIHKKAKRLSLADQTVTIKEAIDIIYDLSDTPPAPPPSVKSVKAYKIDFNDPIFNSIRSDYDGFDDWTKKCQRQHRQCWKIEDEDDKISGVCIINVEKDIPKGIEGKVLKLCTFKVSDRANGHRFGELLLKAVFEYGYRNHFDWFYVTVFEKYQRSVQFFEDFGFDVLPDRNTRGELVLLKPMKPSLSAFNNNDPLTFNIKYGPYFIHPDTHNWCVVPIKREYAYILFPETETQLRLFKMKAPYGNAIRKAYLCHSRKNDISAGTILVFYRTGALQGAIAIGIVESYVRSKSPDEIARKVGKRTIYSLNDINKMCESKLSVLAILFRQSRIITKPIKRDKLETGKVFLRPPQSIMKIKEEGRSWLKETLEI